MLKTCDHTVCKRNLDPSTFLSEAHLAGVQCLAKSTPKTPPSAILQIPIRLKEALNKEHVISCAASLPAGSDIAVAFLINGSENMSQRELGLAANILQEQLGEHPYYIFSDRSRHGRFNFSLARGVLAHQTTNMLFKTFTPRDLNDVVMMTTDSDHLSIPPGLVKGANDIPNTCASTFYTYEVDETCSEDVRLVLEIYSRLEIAFELMSRFFLGKGKKMTSGNAFYKLPDFFLASANCYNDTATLRDLNGKIHRTPGSFDTSFLFSETAAPVALTLRSSGSHLGICLDTTFARQHTVTTSGDTMVDVIESRTPFAKRAKLKRSSSNSNQSVTQSSFEYIRREIADLVRRYNECKYEYYENPSDILPGFTEFLSTYMSCRNLDQLAKLCIKCFGYTNDELVGRMSQRIKDENSGRYGYRPHLKHRA